MENSIKLNKDIIIQGINNFQQTNIAPFLRQCLSKCGFIRPTPIQYHSIINFNKYPNNSIIAQSKSGTGKTLAFLVPILNNICQTKDISKDTVCLIILPTRQLSIQVHQYLKQIIISSNQIKALQVQRQFKNTLKNISSLLSIGGIPIQDDKKTLLTTGANFVIGTVGRIYQLLESGNLKIDNLRFTILDQGDKLFATKDEKLDKILKRIQNILKSKQNSKQYFFRFMVYSATYDQHSIKKISERLQKVLNRDFSIQGRFLYIQTLTNTITNEFIQKVTQDYNELNLVSFNNKNNKNNKNQYKHLDEQQQGIQNNKSIQVKQKQINKNSQLINLQNIKKYCIELQNNKSSIIVRKCNKLKLVLSELQFKKCLIFVQKKALLEQIYDQVKQFEPLLIHGSLSQASRIKAMNQANKSKIIISSDLLARGIDLVLDLVLLFDAQINETFWHRIGRTGRFGRVGIVVSLDRIQNWGQYNSVQINKILRQSIQQQSLLRKNEWYGTYMTEYGRWQQLDVYKQQILNKSYNFYQQNKQMQMSKKDKKQLKQIQKRVVKQIQQMQQQHNNKQIQNQQNRQQNNISQQNNNNKSKQNIKSKFKSYIQFKQYYKEIFKCIKCKQLMNKTIKLTNYHFQIEKYFHC